MTTQTTRRFPEHVNGHPVPMDPTTGLPDINTTVGMCAYLVADCDDVDSDARGYQDATNATGRVTMSTLNARRLINAAVPIPEQTKVRVVTRSTSGDVDLNKRAAAEGSGWVVDSYIRPGEGDDHPGKAYYLLDIEDRSFGGNYWAYPEHVEVMTSV